MLAPESRCAPGDLALLDHRDRDLAELLGQLRLVLEQLHQLVGAGEAGGAAADDRDADLDPLVLGIGRRADHVGAVERRRELDSGRDCAGSSSSAALLGLDRLGQLGDDLVQVADHAEVARTRRSARSGPC